MRWGGAFSLSMTLRPKPCLDLAIPPPMLVKSCIVKPIYQDRGGFEDVYIQTCRTHYHIAALVLYMISHHTTDIMIGQTLQSMLVIIYRRHQHVSLDRQRWRAPRHISTRQHVATKKADEQRTQTRWQNHTTDGLRIDWVGLEAVIGFMVMSVPVTPRKRDDLLPRARMSGTRRDVPADCCRGAWMVLGRSGAEWREAPMQDGTVGGWASRG